MKDAAKKLGVVSGPVVFTFDDPADPGSVQTQLRHGAVVETLEQREVDGSAWSRVRYGWGLSSRYDEAGDEGWLDTSSLTLADANDSAELYAARGTSAGETVWLQTGSITAHGFAKPSRTAGPSVVELPAESWLCGTQLTEVQAAPGAYGSRWWQVELPAPVRGTRVVYFQEGDVQPPGLTRLDAATAMGEAERAVHRPYVWGGASSFGFDCSGLVQMVARRMGVALPHSARRQFTETTTFAGLRAVGDDLAVEEVAGTVRSDDGRGTACSALGAEFATRAEQRWGGVLVPGDVVYFAMGGKRVDHVGLWRGGGEMIHASSSGTPATRGEVFWGSVYAARMTGVRRLG